MSSFCFWFFVLEVLGLIFLGWGVIHEDRLIRFEKRVIEVLKNAGIKMRTVSR